jgi:hypothetical protein
LRQPAVFLHAAFNQMSLQDHRPLIVRSNRALGSMLLEKRLVTPEQLDEANAKFLESLQGGDVRRASILHVLMFEMQVLNEDAYIEAIVEKHGLGLMDLHGCQFRKAGDLQIDLEACWVTWTVPFDLVDDFVMLATLFYSSPPVVKFWQDKYAGKNLLWYVTSVRSLQSSLDRLEQMKNEAALAAKHAAGQKGGTKPAQPAKK